MNRWLPVAVLAAAWLAGCAAPGPVVEGTASTLPQPFTIELRGISKDSRHVMYRLTPGGELEFAGGRDATIRETQPVGRLTDDQLRQLWQIIRDHRLMDASGQVIAVADHTSYEARLTAGPRANSFKTADDKVPGLVELDKALFKLAADLRYENTFKPIESAIDKAGGAVKKK